MRIQGCGRLSALAISLVLLGSRHGPAAAQLLGPEFQVNSFTTNSQSFPAVAADGSGNFLVVWNSLYQDTSAGGVFGQRFDANGNPLGSEFPINSFTASDQVDAAVAADALGGFVVVWRSEGQDDKYAGVFGQHFDSGGDPVGGEFPVNTFTTNAQGGAAIAADSSGNFVVVWESYLQDGSEYGVFGQRFDSAGDPAGDEFPINSHTTGRQSSPAVAADDAGNFVVVWHSDGKDGSSRGVVGQRFDSAGGKLGGEFLVNTFTTGNQQTPVVSADGPGNFVVIWRSAGQDGSSDGVFGQRFDSSAGKLGSEFRVNSYTTNDQKMPAVAVDAAGNFVVAWASRLQDGSDYGVFAQRFDSAGRTVGSELQLNSYTTSAQAFPAVAAAGPGDFVVVWDSDLQQFATYEVFGRQLSWIFEDGFELGKICAWSGALGSSDSCP